MPRIASVLLLLLWSAGCKGADPPLLHAAAQDGTPARAGVDLPKTSEPRPPWIQTPTGRDAIAARERGDHEEAARLLDSVLARRDLYPPERAEASLLRGMVARALGKYAEAAQWFRQARELGSLALLESHLRVWEAQALLDASQPAEALRCIEPVGDVGPPLSSDLLLVKGDAQARAGQPESARAAYDSYLSQFPRGTRIHEARIKLARLLADLDTPDSIERAIALWETLALEVPISDYGRESIARLSSMDGSSAGRSAKEQREFEHRLEVARIEAMVENRRYAEAVAATRRFVKQLRLSPEHRCRALYAEGTAIFKQRQRADARTSFLRASVACRKGGEDLQDYVVKSLYQSCRGWYAEGQYSKAARAFERMAKEFSDHSYADDAWVLAGESWEEFDRAKEARNAYQKALEVDGDMANEAVRRLMLMAFADKDHEQAIKILDDALARTPGSGESRAKLHYFRGRALYLLGRQEDAVAAWVESIRAKPLGYSATQALSRLRDVDFAVFERGLQLLETDSGALRSEPSFDLPAGEVAERAQLLARLGLGEQAQDELDGAKIAGWPAIAVLHHANLHPAVQRRIAQIDDSWQDRAPAADTRVRWEMAFPRPFGDLVEVKEREHDVPSLLAYAIMQTESRFDPNVVSWAGACGLIQLMPETAKQTARQAGLELNGRQQLFDPATNIDLGLRHLGGLVRRFGTDAAAALLAVPSYNAGIGAVQRWLKEQPTWDLDLFVEAIPYSETRRYTQSVMGRWATYRWLYGRDAPADRLLYLPLNVPAR